MLGLDRHAYKQSLWVGAGAVMLSLSCLRHEEGLGVEAGTSGAGPGV